MICNEKGDVRTNTLAIYEATQLGAPFKIILENSVHVKVDEEGNVIETTVPDLAGLIHAVVVARVTHERKLSGHELRFVRKAMGWKSKDLAKKLEMSAEHWSRCEAGDKVLSKTTEKLLRIYCVFKTPDKSAIKELGFGDDFFDMIKIATMWDSSEELIFRFVRRKLEISELDGDEGKWRPDKAA